MKARNLVLTGLVLALGPAALAVAADPPDPPPPPAPLDVTMRVIQDPEAMGPDAVTRRIAMPPPPATVVGEEARVQERVREQSKAPADAGEGNEVAIQARERNREFGEEAAERARDMADDAAERREQLGRSRAEEMRPEPPEPPRPPRP
jgi:hypothetical protein